jgi:hypothetical protein
MAIYEKHGRPNNPKDLVGFADSRVTALNFTECNRLNTRLARGLKKFNPDEEPSPQKRGQMHPSLKLFYWLKRKGEALEATEKGEIAASRMYMEAAKIVVSATESLNRSQKEMAQIAVKVKELQSRGVLGEKVEDLSPEEMEFIEQGVADGRTVDEMYDEVLSLRTEKIVQVDDEED